MGARPTLTLITSTICQAHAAGQWKIKHQRGTEKSLPTMTAQNCDVGVSGILYTSQSHYSLEGNSINIPSHPNLPLVFFPPLCVFHDSDRALCNPLPWLFCHQRKPHYAQTHSCSQLGLFTMGLPASLQLLPTCPAAQVTTVMHLGKER